MENSNIRLSVHSGASDVPRFTVSPSVSLDDIHLGLES